MSNKYILLIFLGLILLGGGAFAFSSWTAMPKPENLKQDSVPVVAEDGCDQSATTTPCATLERLNTDQTLTVNGGESKTYSLGNFTFNYPANASIVEKIVWEGVPCSGVIAVSLSEDGNSDARKVYISTSPSTPCTKFNPKAKTLSDYEKGYRSDDFEEKIHSQERITINGIPMLRQLYSQGYWINNGEEKIFDTNVESGADHQLRYVFFAGNSPVTITGWKAEKYIDQIAQSIRLLK